MDIKLPSNLQNPVTLTKLVENNLALRVGQSLDVKVVNATIKTEVNAIALKLANNTTILVQSNQPIKLLPGQELQIQVTKTNPVLEFALTMISAESKNSQSQNPELRLKVISVTPDNAKQQTSSEKITLPVNQKLAAKIVSLTPNKIQLQVILELEKSEKQATPTQYSQSKPFVTITIDRPQTLVLKANNPNSLVPAPTKSTAESPSTEFKIGQPVILEINQKNNCPEYKISLPPAPSQPSSEQKITEFVKQFLPKHETSPALLNQLIKELPQLVKKNVMPEVLQQLASQLIQTLPERSQLNSSSGLKQAVVNSGLLLEAQLSQASENSENNETPELILHEDFKANLLKLVDTLKKQITNLEKSEEPANDLTVLKAWQQKSENNVAKIVLDQLTSLPKEDSPKQIWTVDIPYLERGQAETVNIRISREKGSNEPADSGNHWSVTISMNPPGLGQIQCNLSFHHDTINTSFRSQQSATSTLISHHLDHLKQQLEDAGLKTGVINSEAGAQPVKSNYQFIKNALFDEKA
jgi:Flagellar hook-length control protein FliK